MELRISVELGAINSVGMAVVRSIGFFKFDADLSFDLIIDSNNRLAAGSYQFGAITIII